MAKHDRNMELREKVLELYKTGITQVDIGKKLDITRQRVNELIKEMTKEKVVDMEECINERKKNEVKIKMVKEQDKIEKYKKTINSLNSQISHYKKRNIKLEMENKLLKLQIKESADVE